MEIKGIDVSSNQKKPNWKKVKASGVEVAILRIHQRYGIDSSFVRNYKRCKARGILVGGYKYSYAKTAAQAEAEADAVLKALNGRKLDFPVFYDLEWSEQRTLGSAAIEKIALAFLKKIKAAGYKVGIYCNKDWYNNVLTPKLKEYDCWIAGYPKKEDDNGTLQERLRPSYGIGWQYSSKGKVPGIKKDVDMDVFYKDYVEKEEAPVKDLWTQTAELMAAQTGYCEKRSDSQLDHKTANAGFANYTKYARDVNAWGQPGCQGQPWCAVYQFWICVKIFGLARALQIMGGGFYNCVSIANHAKANGTWHKEPKLGALVIFRNGSHVGRVTKVTASHIYTNEGNTSKSGQNNIIANGGSVCDKVYTRDYSGIDGYVWIDYSTGSDASSTTTAGNLSKTPKWVGRVTAAELNVRSWAGTEFPLIKKWPKLSKGNLVDVCDAVTDSNGDIWYYIRIADKYYGFVHGDYLKRQ